MNIFFDFLNLKCVRFSAVAENLAHSDLTGFFEYDIYKMAVAWHYRRSTLTLLSRRENRAAGRKQVKEPSFQYRGKHAKHPPDPEVISLVGDTIHFFKHMVPSISSVVEYDDGKNRYTITFAWEGSIFLYMTFVGGSRNCAVYNDESMTVSTLRPFTHNELQCRLIPLRLDPMLAKKEKAIRNIRLNLMPLRDPEDRKEI